MRDMAYALADVTKPLRWLSGTQIKTPPVDQVARRDLGVALRILHEGGKLSMPVSRPMPAIGPGCHELRVRDSARQWRLVYRTDADAILIVDVFPKTTQATPKRVIDRCQRRLRDYDEQK